MAPAPADGESTLDFSAADGSPRQALVRLPRGQPPFPTALILPGMALPGPPVVGGFVASLAKELAMRGVATLRGQGRWTLPGGTPLEELDWHSEIDDGVATWQQLSEQPWADPSRRFVVGLSLGGIAAPRLARQLEGLQGILSWGATARPWIVYADATLRQQLTWREVPADEIERRAKLRDGWFRALARGAVDGAALFAEQPEVAYIGIDEDGYLGRPTRFWQQLCTFDPVQSYGDLACRICVVRGAADFVCHAVDQGAIVTAARR
ncbi:MAG: hypothetical protein JRI68_11625 [Deltaproteobacteria bacterium]|nr:hypothetical protein [Deltaproteobacteria bacterium]